MKISNIFCFNIRPKMVEYKHKKNTQKVDLKMTKYFLGGSKLGVISPKYPRKRVEKTWMCLTGVTVEVWWCPYFVIAAPTALLADSSSSASSYSSPLFFFSSFGFMFLFWTLNWPHRWTAMTVTHYLFYMILSWW